MSTNVKHKELKAKITITLEPSLISYAEQLGRSSVSLGIRHALIEYRDRLDVEFRNKALSAHTGTNSSRIED
mgnify:CR=1 FL=1